MRASRARVGVSAALALSCVLPGMATAVADEIPAEQAAREAQWWLGDGFSAAAVAAKGGAGVKVCLVDSGVDKYHPDLQGAKLSGGKDFSGESSPDGLEPGGIGNTAHGTTMAAWIVGQGHGAGHKLGVMGVAPRATLMSVVAGKLANEGPAVRYCVGHGAKVISISSDLKVTADLAAYALSKDVVIVHAVANDDYRKKGAKKSCMDVPDVLQYGVLFVTGSGRGGVEDPQTCMNGDFDRHRETNMTVSGVAVAAPSGGRAGTDPTFAKLKPLVLAIPVAGTSSGDNTYRLGNGGSSTATALTAGVVALVRAAHPELDAANVINRVVRSGRRPVSGEALGADAKWGFGIVDAKAAVTGDFARVSKNPLGDPRTGDQGVWTGQNRRKQVVTAYGVPGKAGASATPSSGSSGSGSSGSGSVQSSSSGSSDAGSAKSGSSVVPWVLGAGVLVVAAGVGAAVLASRRRRGGQG